jgi:hypothetical protein
MNTQNIQINVPLNFNQVVDIVRQLSPKDKMKLKAVLQEEQNMVIPEKQKEIVRQRMKVSDAYPSRLLNWDDVKHKIKL